MLADGKLVVWKIDRPGGRPHHYEAMEALARPAQELHIALEVGPDGTVLLCETKLPNTATWAELDAALRAHEPPMNLEEPSGYGTFG